MAGGAAVRVDLEAPRRRGAVEGAERAVEGPVQFGQRRLRLVGGAGGRTAQQQAGDAGGDQSELAHHGFSIGRVAAGAMRPPPFAVTAALMLVGSGSGRSILPMSHIRKKCRK